jgi:hypothetical protein
MLQRMHGMLLPSNDFSRNLFSRAVSGSIIPALAAQDVIFRHQACP